MFLTKLLSFMLCLTMIHPTPPEDPLDDDPQKPLGNVTPVEISISQFENTHKADVLLPKFIPFIPTHSGSSYNETLQSVTVDYLNQKTSELLSLTISVQTELKQHVQSKEVTLADGTKAMYVHGEEYVADFLHFQKAGLTYELGISKNGQMEKLSALIKVANSLQ